MDRNTGRGQQSGGRMQWGSYGFVAGLSIGVLLGWMLSGFIGAFIRVGIVALVVIPIVLLFLAWRRFVTPVFEPPPRREYVAGPDAIEARAVVQAKAREPLRR
mgnify:CR=1 FL=1